VLAKMILQQKN